VDRLLAPYSDLCTILLDGLEAPLRGAERAQANFYPDFAVPKCLGVDRAAACGQDSSTYMLGGWAAAHGDFHRPTAGRLQALVRPACRALECRHPGNVPARLPAGREGVAGNRLWTGYISNMEFLSGQWKESLRKAA
jgi:hypothetical protein